LTRIAGSRVAVVGGSIAGCAVAVALIRAGCEVTVFERTRGSLRDRGFGIGLPPGTLDRLVAADYLLSTDAGEQRFDLVVGADGYASAVRRRIAPESSLHLPGYCLWRGTYPVSLLSAAVPGELGQSVTSVCFPGGHCLIYLIPDQRDPARRLVNWAAYITTPRPVTDTHGYPPGQIPLHLMQVLERVVDQHFPPLWADVIRRTPSVSRGLLPGG
jgi:2-polyprenyl-6-methoxyphenol hydroxylase-like FAD-dependent oxidoreductase